MLLALETMARTFGESFEVDATFVLAGIVFGVLLNKLVGWLRGLLAFESLFVEVPSFRGGRHCWHSHWLSRKCQNLRMRECQKLTQKEPLPMNRRIT